LPGISPCSIEEIDCLKAQIYDILKPSLDHKMDVFECLSQPPNQCVFFLGDKVREEPTLVGVFLEGTSPTC
jgi:hypothetical protein